MQKIRSRCRAAAFLLLTALPLSGCSHNSDASGGPSAASSAPAAIPPGASQSQIQQTIQQQAAQQQDAARNMPPNAVRH